MTEVSHEREDGRIICMIDKAPCHSIQIHLKQFHPKVSVDDYQREYPGAPLFSQFALDQIAEKRRKDAAAAPGETAKPVIASTTPAPIAVVGKRPFHEVFGLGSARAALSSKGEAIMIDVFEEPNEIFAGLVPFEDPNYVFDIGLTKDIIIGFALGMNTYLWGFHGSGKTSALEQACSRTRRLFQRVQHTNDMESSHVVGQYVVFGGATVWQDGPLPLAMKMGAVYCADEYDAAQPGVIAVYQAVMEGRPLIIKEAPPEHRVVTPHPNFRFVATGNTNGSGDETGLYQGTQIQNAANYSRFAITKQVNYMDEGLETSVLMAQAKLQQVHAKKFIGFGKEVRKAHGAGTIGCIVSTRELISAARIGTVKMGDWREGLNLAFINRATKVDQDVLQQFAQRVFG